MSGKRKGYFCLDAQSESHKATPGTNDFVDSSNCGIPVLLVTKSI
jgi:hypothetical protein